MVPEVVADNAVVVVVVPEVVANNAAVENSNSDNLKTIFLETELVTGTRLLSLRPSISR